MGNVCCGESEERPKASALESFATQDESAPLHTPAPSAAAAAVAPPPQQEQLRRLQIVNSYGQTMIPVRSSRGPTNYYDQGFAAALKTHLEETTEFPPLEYKLPPCQGNSQRIHELLSAQPYNKKHEDYLNNLAETYLQQVVPTPERLLRNAPAIVENLL